jgi:colicin import membrane protein
MLDAYFSLLYQRLREAHEKPTGLSDLLSAMAEYRIDGDGAISNVRIIRSSGSPEFDQSVLSAFRNVGSIGPRPDRGGPMIKKVLFKMRED